MFERYTEKARRVIFFGRYEASVLASPYIESEHLLLEMLRECPLVRQTLRHDMAEIVRKRFQPADGQKRIAASVDLPLSQDAKLLLALACSEAELLGDQDVDCQHLFLGFLSSPPTAVHDLTAEHNGPIHELLSLVRKGLVRTPFNPRLPSTASAGLELFVDWITNMPDQPATEFSDLHKRLIVLLLNAAEWIEAESLSYGEGRLHRRRWTRKQALAYLSDWASQYRLWLARATCEPSLRASMFPAPEWISDDLYRKVPWPSVVNTWFHDNCLLLGAIEILPSSKALLPCRIGVEPTTLHQLLTRYVDTVEDILEQVLAHL